MRDHSIYTNDTDGVDPLNMAAVARSVRVLITFGVCCAAACGGNPVEPSPDSLTLSCPINVDLEATAPSGATAIFDQPTARGGRPPFNIECSPAGGTVFPIGDTQIVCTGTDADSKRASCSFTIRVRVSQTLTRTRFLSFGDSITAGTVSNPALELMAIDKPDSYPFKLEQMLRAQYPAQEVSVLNRGWGGERLDEGVSRLPAVLDADRPEVLLLLEGIIEVRRIPTARNAGYLRTMILAAQQRGTEVILATVMPVSAALEAKSPGTNAAVIRLNTEIARLAQEFGLGNPVDLFALFQAQPHLLGADGLHPTIDGYTRIAETFRQAVVSRYDTRAQPARMTSR